jgi:hypothetical protein
MTAPKPVRLTEDQRARVVRLSQNEGLRIGLKEISRWRTLEGKGLCNLDPKEGTMSLSGGGYRTTIWQVTITPLGMHEALQ